MDGSLVVSSHFHKKLLMAIKIVECYSISPSSEGGAASDQSLPLLYFDIIFLKSRPTETLNFYGLKCSESCFLETIVVNLKHSLSVTLKHFLPLAGKIIFPLSSNGMPISQYAAGDSVALTIAISDANLADLTGNHSKAADELHHFVPQLPQAVYSDSDDSIKFSVVAFQVTLFPNQGICIGFTHHHAICDATSLFAFINAWATIHQLNSDGQFVGNIPPSPFYDRSRVQDAETLAAIGWNQMKTSRPTVSLTLTSFPSPKLRATFILSDAEIEKLKNLAMIKKPAGVARVSSFVVVCAHLWSCLAAAAVEEVADDEPEYFATPVDCRTRLNPRLPDTYFGNCLVFSWAESTHGRLKGSEGFWAAVEAIATAIRRSVDRGGRGVLHNFENESGRDAELNGKRVVSIVGSLKIDHYGADYGWGSAIKYECIHTDFDGGVDLCKGRDGGVELGLSMPKVEMDAFAAIFNNTYLYINSNL